MTIATAIHTGRQNRRLKALGEMSTALEIGALIDTTIAIDAAQGHHADRVSGTVVPPLEPLPMTTTQSFRSREERHITFPMFKSLSWRMFTSESTLAFYDMRYR